MEIIICAAVLYDNGAITLGRGHHECFYVAAMWNNDAIGKDGQLKPYDEWKAHELEHGFITSNRRFVDRVEALRIAKEAGQIFVKHGRPDRLYSEDLEPVFYPKK